MRARKDDIYDLVMLALFAAVLYLLICGLEAPVRGDEPKNFTARVIRVVDGDTLYVDGSNASHSIRLAKIDAPERLQPGGLAAREYLESLVIGKSVDIEVLAIDRYGRRVALVTLVDQTKPVNLRMVEAGWAWHYKQYDKDPVYDNAQERAKAEGRGLWSRNMANPIPPWNWRFGRRR